MYWLGSVGFVEHIAEPAAQIEFEHAVTGVVADAVDDGDLVGGGRPERLHGQHGAAVADHGDHALVGGSQRYA